MSVQLSEFAKSLNVETAFTVLAAAKKLKAAGKDVVELERSTWKLPSCSSHRDWFSRPRSGHVD
ncbi:hypothetical protein E3A20_23940 [Planctomyces bekefii]|uniref:Uncharacterized protein n=1 Tax=Planctomyces bekefii TaxID=1653850 RepID=A0A5C6M162_9PLAN|nr:hypothetical protein E3A20_23940 [Planctomyces bekefii]